MHAAKEWLLRIGMVVVSLLVSLLIAEGMVRLFFPIYDGRNNVTLSGETIKDWFAAREACTGRCRTSTTPSPPLRLRGTVCPAPRGSPDVVFIGDSFTYGYGLQRRRAFASDLLRESKRRPCANLGIPIERHRQASSSGWKNSSTTWQWQPKEVKFFFFGMSGSLSAGNDFVDNYNYGRWLKAQAAGTPVPRARAPRRQWRAG